MSYSLFGRPTTLKAETSDLGAFGRPEGTVAAVTTVAVWALEGVAVGTEVDVLAGGRYHVTAVAGP